MITSDDTWTFALHQRLFGQTVINTFAMDVNAPAQQNVSEQTFINDCFAPVTGYFNQAGNLRLNIASIQSPQMEHVKWTAKRVRGVLTTTFEIGIDNAAAGTRAGDAETANLAMSIARKGTSPERRDRGRIAVAGVPTADYAAGVFGAVILGLAETIVDEMIGMHTPSPGINVQLGFWSGAHVGLVNGAVTVYEDLWVPCFSGAVRSTVRVQRSRTVGVGS
jgi:hypothetical protein